MQLIQRFTIGSSYVKRIMLALGFLAACPTLFAQLYKPEQILSRVPTQADVDVDTPTEEETPNCKVKSFKEGAYQGVALYKPDGVTPLRAWCAPTPTKQGEKASVEQIRFYKNGQEVFRDVLGKEARWLNTAGSRRGTLAADKTISAWTVLSPEEATQEIVAAIVNNDYARFQRVALSEEDMKTLGLTGSLAAEVQKEIQSANAANFATLVKTLKTPADAHWGAFNTSLPATIPAGSGSANDLTLYYNAAIVVLKGDDASQNQQLYVGDLIKVGNVWKILGLPAGEAFGQATGTVSASSIFFPAVGGASAGAETTADVGEFGTQLNEAFEKLDAASPEEYAGVCDQTVELLLNIAENNPSERENMLSQAVNVIFSGVQSGLYPQGAQKLAALEEACGDDVSENVKALVKHRLIVAEFYAVAQAQPQPKQSVLQKAQEKYADDLTAFVDEYSTTPAGAEAAMSLALDQEYVLENDAAIEYYQKVAQNFGDTPIGQKATGAIARLQSEGGKLNFPAMKYFGGGVCDVAALTGKPTIIFCWASWDQESVDAVKKIASLVNVVGVNLDSAPTAEAANDYFKQIFAGIPWKNVCDPAGLEGAPATALGVQTAPWAILIDKSGKVVRSNIVDMNELADIIKELK
ncbi:MAG: TlpA family protein disulfide reductase [Thermoguttaceae bacterium]|nr:TlpA family protein disulfide reductase [Thermoguttaceae bacterium]